MGFSLMSGAGVDGNTPYQAQELQITTLASPGKQANFLFNSVPLKTDTTCTYLVQLKAVLSLDSR